jgi:hypothetical protein
MYFIKFQNSCALLNNCNESGHIDYFAKAARVQQIQKLRPMQNSYGKNIRGGLKNLYRN